MKTPPSIKATYHLNMKKVFKKKCQTRGKLVRLLRTWYPKTHERNWMNRHIKLSADFLILNDHTNEETADLLGKVYPGLVVPIRKVSWYRENLQKQGYTIRSSREIRQQKGP